MRGISGGEKKRLSIGCGTRAAAAGAARARLFLIVDKDVMVSPCNPTLFPATDAMQARLLRRSVHRRNRRSKRVFARCTWPQTIPTIRYQSLHAIHSEELTRVIYSMWHGLHVPSRRQLML